MGAGGLGFEGCDPPTHTQSLDSSFGKKAEVTQPALLREGLGNAPKGALAWHKGETFKAAR